MKAIKRWRVEVGFLPGVRDARGESVKSQIEEDLDLPIKSVRTQDVYYLNGSLTLTQAERIAAELLTDPIIQRYGIDTLCLGEPFQVAVEVGYKYGVTDNVGMTTVEGIRDLLGSDLAEPISVNTARLYVLKGNLSVEKANWIAQELLANELVEDVGILTPGTSISQLASTPKAASKKPKVATVDLDVSDQELVEISKRGLLALNLEEMRRVRDYFKDPNVLTARKAVGLGVMPTDVELEMLAQTWSEHCKHKIMNATIDYSEDGRQERIDSLFKTYIKRATEEIAKTKQDWLVSVFSDNAGIISFDDEHNAVFKVETHNHPSALEPYGGALTGIVGVNRDPMGTGLGANLIFNTDVFCFGPPDFPRNKLPKSVLHPKRVLRGVRKGVEDGGNKIGIPTVNGAILFDEAYVYNPLVYCGTGGLMPKKVDGQPSHMKKVEDGDLIVMVGGRIGKDGIHGATFSSIKLDEETPTSPVQIGAPIVQKRMQDALMEARDLGLYSAITDNGAGGLSSSVGEMAEFCGGCRVDLEKAPVKYAGLDPWELWVSESQERMTVAVPPGKIEAFLDLCRRRDVEATVIGEFKADGKIKVRYDGRTVVYLDLDFVHEGLPTLQLKAKSRVLGKAPAGAQDGSSQSASLAAEDGSAVAASVGPAEALKRILGSLNVCSKEWVIRQYDHEVQGGSVIKPLVGISNDGPSDAAVIRPVYGSKRGLVVSNGINPEYGKVDAYAMAASAIDEAVRNCVAVGADPERIAILDNFCWGNPILSEENPEGDLKLGKLVRAAKACYDTAVGLGTPFISGKDSFHNEYEVGGRTVSIPETLLISALGTIEDCDKAVSMDAKKAGDLVYVLGRTRAELGGSHYAKVAGLEGGSAPSVNAAEANKLFLALHEAMKAGLAASCHDCSEGGLAVAAAETAFAGRLGLTIDLSKVPTDGELSDETVLFSESNSRFVVTVSAENREAFETSMAGNTIGLIGEVKDGDRLVADGRLGNRLFDLGISDLKENWQDPLRW